MLKIDKVYVPAQSGNIWNYENFSNAEIHLENKTEKV